MLSLFSPANSVPPSRPRAAALARQVAPLAPPGSSHGPGAQRVRPAVALRCAGAARGPGADDARLGLPILRFESSAAPVKVQCRGQ
ncbi:uncharacterized protein VTP21DRAFT_1743 [Calcarisporiella thermophila]|uniref:uncharacterized protein n=1 Tax=Calcarisporiella thermophila TaxID=911321 RepID=UPI00374426B6